MDFHIFIELSWKPWDEAYLIMVNDHIDVFLDLVCKNFIGYFFINIHKEIGLKFSVCGFGIRVIVAS